MLLGLLRSYYLKERIGVFRMSTSISIITFSGENKDWNVWSMRFLARATLGGYIGVMKGAITVVPDSYVTTDAEELKYRELNRSGFCELLLSMKSKNCLVSESLDTNFPDGNLFTAWDNLKNIYEPSDITSKIKIIDQFSTLKLSKGTRAED